MRDDTTTLGVPLADRLVLFAVIPGIALTAGWLVPIAARWALSLEQGLPFRVVFRVAGAIDQPWEIGVNLALWLIAGLAIGLTGWGESVTALVSDVELVLVRDGRSQVIRRRDAGALFPSNGQLVVLDQQSREVMREKLAAGLTEVEAALRQHRYPWQDADPHAALYRPWTRGSPELPQAAHALLTARAAALRTKDADQADALRHGLHDLGLAVRDESHQQQWRPLVRT